MEKLVFSATEDVFLTINAYAESINCTNQINGTVQNTTFMYNIPLLLVSGGQGHTEYFIDAKNGSDLLCANRYELYVQSTTDFGRFHFHAKLHGCITGRGKNFKF